MLKEITELQALAQSGLAFCKDAFDIQRYQRILEITARLAHMNSSHDYDELLEVFTSDTGYATPKIDVRGAVFKNNKILLVQEKTDGLWALPGGFADVNLSPIENVLKEIKEESGFHCHATKLIGVFDKRKHTTTPQRWPHVYKLFFLCTILDEYNQFDTHEILDINFFDYDNLPSLSEGRVNKHQIMVCFEHYKNPALNTVFE